MNLYCNSRHAASYSGAASARPAVGASQIAKHRTDGQSRFDIYRSEVVSLTSTLFGGGDWHWRLAGPSGIVLADCGGYRNQAECLAAVEALRTEAGSATLSRTV
jgi:uncharacterized protein YegP (UPF0339 family)